MILRPEIKGWNLRFILEKSREDMHKKINLPAASVIASFDLMSGSIMAFAMVFLLANDLTEDSIGYLIAGGNILAAITQPIISDWADRSKHKSIYFFMLILLIPLILALVGILSLRHIGVLLVIFYMISLALIAVLVPFHNSLIMYLINNGYHINFGSIRSAGSLSYAVTATIVGILIENYGTDSIIYYGIIGWFVYFMAVSLLHVRYAKPIHGYSADSIPSPIGQDQQGFRFLSKYPSYKWLLFGAFFNFIAFNIINMFMFQIMTNVGGGASEMGFAFSLAALSEIPSMNLYGFFSKKVGHHNILRLASVFFLIQVALVTFASSVFGVYVGQAFQSLAFAVYIVGIVYYINDLMDHFDKVKGQSYVTMAQTLGGVLGSAVGGWILKQYSIQLTLFFALACAFIGMLAFQKALSAKVN